MVTRGASIMTADGVLQQAGRRTRRRWGGTNKRRATRMRDESFCETDTEWTGRVKERCEQCTMTASFPENGQKQSPSISGATSRKPATANGIHEPPIMAGAPVTSLSI